MFSRLRSTSIVSLIDLSSSRSESENPSQPPPHSFPGRQRSLNLLSSKQNLSTPSPLSGHFGRARRCPSPSPQDERTLEVSKKELSEVVEQLQQVRPHDLSQARVLLSLMVAILSDTPKCRECMRENGGFLTLMTVLASLGGHALPESSSSLTEEGLNLNPICHTAAPSPQNHIELPSALTDSPLPCKWPELHDPDLEEEREAVVTLVFKCLALALSKHHQNQMYFSAKVRFKLVLDAIRLSNFMPGSIPHNSSNSLLPHSRRQKIEKMFGILFAFIVADFSCLDIFTKIRLKFERPCGPNPIEQKLTGLQSAETYSPDQCPGSGDGLGAAVPIPTKVDFDSKYTKLSEYLSQLICERADALHVEIADAVLLLFALHADLFLSSDTSSQSSEDNYELCFLSLKAIEILASTSKRSQIALNSIELTGVLLERLVPWSNPSSSLSDRKVNENSYDLFTCAGLEAWKIPTFGTSTQGKDKFLNRLGDRQCRQVSKSIIQKMLQLGSSPREARNLFRKAVNRIETSSTSKESLDEDCLELILLGMQGSKCPPFIHFGSPKDGCAYAVLESLGANVFPPLQSSGWTFVAWLQIESFGTDPNATLELLTLSDPDDECFVRIAISKSSSVIIQTAHDCPRPSSITTESSKSIHMTTECPAGPSAEYPSAHNPETSVEFTQIPLVPGRFYHLAVVQQLGHKTSSSAVSLLIDGECLGVFPISWPRTPRLPRVSAHFGLSRSQGFKTTDSPHSPAMFKRDWPRWSLGGCWLFNQALCDEVLFVMFTLGPKIFTCFQDALGSFQTYSSSTLLNLKIDNLRNQADRNLESKANSVLTASRLNKSPLIKAIKESASAFIPQKSLYFALSAKNGVVIPDNLKHVPSLNSSFSNLFSNHVDHHGSINSVNYMQKVYTTISPKSFCRQALSRDTSIPAPTSSAFGPSFANGILNASTPNSKASIYLTNIVDHHGNNLGSSQSNPSSSKISLGFSPQDQILELNGEVRLCSPKGLDDSIWKACGSIFLVRLIQLSTTEKQLAMTLQIFFEAISHNWRLSEDAEKIHAYETLSLILRSKANLITSSVHRILLRFAGIVVDDPVTCSVSPDKSWGQSCSSLPYSNVPNPEFSCKQNSDGLRDSFITNPLAFRFLLLDFDLWSSTTVEVQLFHFRSLCGIIANSTWSRFSVKRISKMNLLPKMLHALRTRQFSILKDGGAVIPAYIKLLGCVLKAQFDSQTVRHLASYLTASLIPDRPSRKGSKVDVSLVAPFDNRHKSQPMITKLNVPQADPKSLSISTNLDEPIMVLQVLHDLLLSLNEQESSNYISQFLKAINGSKWLLMFFRKDTHPQVVTYSLRILTRLIQTQDYYWLQNFKNTLAGFTILRSVLTRFCFHNESIFVTTLSLLSQVDIRTVPMFGPATSSAHQASFLMLKDDLQGVTRSIRGTPHETVTPELLPIIIGLIKPVYVVRCSQENMIPIYAMEWLDLRMESQDDGWNELLGDKDIVRFWANYVTLLSCLPYQEGLHTGRQKAHKDIELVMGRASSAAACLSSFPFMFRSTDPFQPSQLHTGACTTGLSDRESDGASLAHSNDMLRINTFPGKLRRFSLRNQVPEPLSITVPTAVQVNGEIAALTPLISQFTSPIGTSPIDVYCEESDLNASSASLYSYDNALEVVIQNLSKITERFLISFIFDQTSTLSHSKSTGNRFSRQFEKKLRCNRIQLLLNLVIDRSKSNCDWFTPFFNKVTEVIVLETDPSSIPVDWLISTMTDGYLSGWLQPDARYVSSLVSFLTTKNDECPIAPLGDLLLIVLSNRCTSSPEILLEQLCSHHLTNMIAAVPPELVPRLVYILTQYLSHSSNLQAFASDILKLLFSYHPFILEEFYLDIDSSRTAEPFSVSSDVQLSASDHSMSQVERDLSKVLQMQSDELREVLENSSSINLTGKLDWIRFVTESEFKANRIRLEMLATFRVVWNEYSNKISIEARRLDNVAKKMEVWARSVKEIDASRFANLRQDNFDTKQYLEMQLSKRCAELYRPFSILAQSAENTSTCWALDSTEGPSRQRKKLRRLPLRLDNQVVQRPKARHHRVRSLGTSRRDSYKCDEVSDGSKKKTEECSPTSLTHHESSIHINYIWCEEPEEDDNADTTDVSVNTDSPKSLSHRTVRKTTGDDAQSEDINEDKFRRILKSLEVGDVIQGVWNVEQVIGLDTCPALFLIAKNNIYIIDGFFQRSNGELVNSWDAWEERDPHLRTLASLSRQTAKLNSRAAAHQTRRWSYNDIVSISPRKWLFRDICIEFLFADGRSRLLTFSDSKRDEALKRLQGSIRKSVGPEILSHMNQSLKSQTELWRNGQISNQAYLLYLNDAAGRTYRDLTQYPVFPWILADYTSSKLDLEAPQSFRKLNLPMGAQTEARKRDFIERFVSLLEFGTIGDERMKPAHYMTHYSSAVVVCGFLIRLQPFCDHFIEIQGSFDHADRTFWSIHRAWLSASEQSRSDVRELIPEFFHCPDFLLNMNKLNLGSRQEGGDPIGDVELPPWAHGDPRLFVELHREALESDFVSENIHQWVDLIFGYKQRGPEALSAINVFQELSYEGTVSLDAITDDRERSSVLGAMCNWGLTPSQIFDAPHPPRGKQAKHPLDARSIITATTCSALIQSIVPIRDIKQPIGQIHPGTTLEKIIVSGPQSLIVPLNTTHRLDWGFLDQTLRIFDSSNSLCATFEGVSSEHISSACFADHRTLATGSTDSTISLWRFAWLANGGAHLQQIEVLRGHSAPITCVVASRTLSIVVSAAEDGLAMIWDLNRALLVHSLPHPNPVSFVAISESTGDIATCSHNTVQIWSINGDLLSMLSTSQYTPDSITACCWSLAEVKPLFVTGHRGGQLMFWQRRSVHAENPKQPWKMELIHTTQHQSYNASDEIRVLIMIDRILLSGDNLGRLFYWSLPGSACRLPDSMSTSCMLCGYRRFGILEGKKRCTCCSAITCSSCQESVPGWISKCCTLCLPKLMNFVDKT